MALAPGSRAESPVGSGGRKASRLGVGERAGREHRQRRGVLQGLEVEEVVHRQGVGQQPLQAGNVVSQLLVAQLHVGYAGLDVQALAFLGLGGHGAFVGPVGALGLTGRPGRGRCFCLTLAFGFPLDLDERRREASIPAHTAQPPLPAQQVRGTLTWQHGTSEGVDSLR